MRAGNSLAKAAEHFKRNRDTIRIVRNTDPELKAKAHRRVAVQETEPTVEEIAAACAEFRKGWSEDEYHRRAIGAKRNSLSGKELEVLVYNMDFAGRKGRAFFTAQG